MECLGEIATRGYLGRRLEWDQWKRFYYDVMDAYRETVTPLLGLGVVGCAPTSTRDCGHAWGPKSSKIANDGGWS